jgi:hypothetical protein
LGFFIEQGARSSIWTISRRWFGLQILRGDATRMKTQNGGRRQDDGG